jgi:hypothetical protein
MIVPSGQNKDAMFRLYRIHHEKFEWHIRLRCPGEAMYAESADEENLTTVIRVADSWTSEKK